MRDMIRVPLLLLAVAMPLAANADMQEEMNKMFGQMSNVTQPGVYNNSRRGVISGGSVAIRNNIQPVNLINFAPPSFSGGCGGIDANFGALSFVSGAQVTQLMRSVAANAEGLAFQMAISAISDKLSQEMSFFSKVNWDKVTQLKNSCEIAKTMVNSAANAVNSYAQQNASWSLVSTGSASDAAAANANPNAVRDAADSDTNVKRMIAQNVVWSALREHNTAEAFGTSNGDEFDEELMSLTGTVITCIPGKDPSCAAAPDGSDGVGVTYTSPTLELADLVYGSGTGSGGRTPMVLRCDTREDCMNPHAEPWQNQGFIEKVNEMLGTDGHSGYLAVLLSGEPASPQVQAFISNAGVAGAMLMRVAQTSPATAASYAKQIAPMLALELAYEQAKVSLQAVSDSMQGVASPAATQVLAKIAERRRELDEAYKRLAGMPNMSDRMVNLANIWQEYAGGSTTYTVGSPAVTTGN